jgi:hypothetical protein
MQPDNISISSHGTVRNGTQRKPSFMPPLQPILGPDT